VVSALTDGDGRSGELHGGLSGTEEDGDGKRKIDPAKLKITRKDASRCCSIMKARFTPSRRRY
jgi:hypothetical protein